MISLSTSSQVLYAASCARLARVGSVAAAGSSTPSAGGAPPAGVHAFLYSRGSTISPIGIWLKTCPSARPVPSVVVGRLPLTPAMISLSVEAISAAAWFSGGMGPPGEGSDAAHRPARRHLLRGRARGR